MKNVLEVLEGRKADLLQRLKNGSASKDVHVRQEQREELRNRIAEVNVIIMLMEE